MEYKAKSSGFTLIELMIYLVLVMLLTGIVISAFLWTLRLDDSIDREKQVLAAQRQAFRVAGYWIREARDIYTPTSSTTQLSLITTTGTPLGESVTYVDFYKCGTRLCLKREAKEPVFLIPASVELENIKFETISTGTAPSVRMHVSLKAADDRGAAVSAATTSISLRGF